VICYGEVFWVNLDPVIGSEADKTRHGRALSNDIYNEIAATVTVLALSTPLKHVDPFEVLLKKNVL
jgi:mRNA interferase MazF